MLFLLLSFLAHISVTSSQAEERKLSVEDGFYLQSLCNLKEKGTKAQIKRIQEIKKGRLCKEAEEKEKE